MMARVLIGDVRERLAEIPSGSVRTCVTSPPYFGLRDYGHDGQLGLEPTPDEYVANMVGVFREVRRVLADDGTLWLNLGDSYASYRDGKATPDTTRGDSNGTLVPKGSAKNRMASTFDGTAIKHKDLIGIPWRVAFALRADGWWLRQDVIWAKPNPMPESVTDRCTKSHEYLFLLSKSARYFYDADAIAEPVTQSSIDRLSQDIENQEGSDRVPGKTNGNMKAVSRGSWNGSEFHTGKTAEHQLGRASKNRGVTRFGGTKYGDSEDPAHRTKSGNIYVEPETRNKRDVWTITTKPFKGAHFAVMPEALVEPCILAGSARGDTVLDPFAGSGTVAVVALRHGRDFIGCELNPHYAEMARARILDDSPLYNECVTA